MLVENRSVEERDELDAQLLGPRRRRNTAELMALGGDVVAGRKGG